MARRFARELPSVAGVREAEGLLPADSRSAKDWDVCLLVTFDSADDLQGYAEDSRHRSLVDEFLRPRLEVIKAWNFAPATD